MIRIVTLLLISVAVFSAAEEIPFNTCFYPDAVDGPSSADLIKTDDGYKLDVKFWANGIGQNSPLKVRIHGSDFNSVTRLVHVSYPIETSLADNKYTEHKITLTIPKTDINSDRVQLALYKVSNDGTENAVWCMMTSIKVLNGMKEEVMTLPPQPPLPPPMPRPIPIGVPANSPPPSSPSTIN